MKSIKQALFLLFMVIALTTALLGCGQAEPEETVPEEPGSALALSVTKAGTNQEVIREDMEDIFIDGIRYQGVTDVCIQIAGESIALEDAFRDQLIYPEDIFAAARKDARNGLCQELYESRHGLTYFTYRYPDFDLSLAYDLFSTPDGEEHLICDLGVYAAGSAPPPHTAFYDYDTMKRLDEEDWGLAFTISEVSSAELAFTCTQSGGQQIGDLIIDDYILVNGSGAMKELKSFAPLAIPLNKNAETQLTLDLENRFGSLPSGDYVLHISVRDIFEESQLHPLMDDFHDWQTYSLTFRIE